MKTFITAISILLCAATAQAALVTRTIEYHHGDKDLIGYLAYDDALTEKEKRPGVLVVHEWMGPGPYVRQRAEQLARLGYVAFAADIYGRGVRPQTPKAAAQESAKYKRDRALLRARAQAALDELKKQPQVDPAKIAAIGYCFGGTTVLELARGGAPLAGVVSFHGALDAAKPDEGKNIRARVLALHGADDPYVPLEQVQAFQDEMRRGGVDWQMIIYGGAVHSFTNPNAGSDNAKGAAYNKLADHRSWAAMRQFFTELFGAETGK